MDSTENPNPFFVIRRTCRMHNGISVQFGMNKPESGLVTFEMKGMMAYANSFK